MSPLGRRRWAGTACVVDRLAAACSPRAGGSWAGDTLSVCPVLQVSLVV